MGARAVDVASFVAIEKIGNFASNPFAIRGGTGLFGRRGLSLGRVKIDALYENPNAGGGTYFSIRRGNNFLRFDRGYLHGTQKVRNHMQFRLTVRGTTFGGTNQQRALYPPFRLF